MKTIIQYIPQYMESAAPGELFPEEFFRRKRMNVFDPSAVEFLSEISKSILAVKDITTYPELVALAYWLRKSHLGEMETLMREIIRHNEIVVPRGVAFHVAPSNVDSIFLYSWCLSLLAGNINIVRISRTLSPQMSLLIDVIRSVVNSDLWKEIRDRNSIMTYDHDSEINSYFSSRADIRVMWGGDETIRTIRSAAAKPTTKELAFADKVSLTVIDSQSVTAAAEADIVALGKKFYNDIYWFDQKACSSPRIVFFVGDEKIAKEASGRFWKSVHHEISRREAEDPASIAMDKLVFAFETTAKRGPLPLADVGYANAPSIVPVPFSEIATYRENCGGGFLFESVVPSLDAILSCIQPNDQTLTYYGFSKERLETFLRSLGGSGIDRIVPIGEALSFYPVWDGYDLLEELTKKIVIL